MPKYTFTFKKDDMFVEFITTDKYLVEKQFPIWVEDASINSKKKALKAQTEPNKVIEAPATEPAPMPEAQAEQILSEEPVETESPMRVEPEVFAEKAVLEETVEEITPEEEPVVEEQKAEETTEQDTAPEIMQESQPEENAADEGPEEHEFVPETNQEEVSEVENSIDAEPMDTENIAPSNAEIIDETVFDKASSLLKTINSIQNPEPPETVDFEQVLEQTIENPNKTPMIEPNTLKDENFLEFVALKNTTDKFHYLMITAYYLSEVEKTDRFSLKQLNAKLMQNLSTLIDHTVLQDALTQGFIDIVPDLTDSSNVCEYRLTEQGEAFFHSF